jgi:hypothetical protein
MMTLIRRVFYLCLCLWVLIGCAPSAAATMTPMPTATALPPPNPVLPDICIETNHTYRLIQGSYYVTPSVSSAATSTYPPLTSPDGSYSVQQVANDLVLRPESGNDIVLAPIPYEGFLMSEYVHWSHDSQHVALIEGTQFFTQALNIRVYDLEGESVLLPAKLIATCLAFPRCATSPSGIGKRRRQQHRLMVGIFLALNGRPMVNTSPTIGAPTTPM